MGDSRVLTGRPIGANSRNRTLHGPLLALLTSLFACRVAGQALVASVGMTWLPAMEQWFSGLIPYPTLLIIQLLMLVVMIKNHRRDLARQRHIRHRAPALVQSPENI